MCCGVGPAGAPRCVGGGRGLGRGSLTKYFSSLKSVLAYRNLHILSLRFNNDLKYIRPILEYLDHP